MHCLGHQKGEDPIFRWNNQADTTTKEAALQMTTILRSPPPKMVLPMLPDFSLYTNQELQRIRSCTSAYKDKDGWFKTPDGRVILPTDFATHLVQQVHQSTHLGEKKMQDDLLRKTHLRVVGLKAKMAEALGWCLKCHLVNAKSMVIRTGHRERRTKNQTRNKLGNQLH